MAKNWQESKANQVASGDSRRDVVITEGHLSEARQQAGEDQETADENVRHSHN
ncbi:hypothetical protein GCM10023195_22000 [Actinoallomurus liliacearum]|uniref:CsbD-like domain-containing protein n=1 Tax=Actinoallomurus liliacearum TaxID=1080073 RepID=A0ABP8TIK8_9ACTN